MKNIFFIASFVLAFSNVTAHTASIFQVVSLQTGQQRTVTANFAENVLEIQMQNDVVTNATIVPANLGDAFARAALAFLLNDNVITEVHAFDVRRILNIDNETSPSVEPAARERAPSI